MSAGPQRPLRWKGPHRRHDCSGKLGPLPSKLQPLEGSSEANDRSAKDQGNEIKLVREVLTGLECALLRENILF